MDLGARRGWAAIILLLLGGPAAAQTSEWKTDYGQLILEQDGTRISGHYPTYQGTLFGEYQPAFDLITATWVQPQSEVQCNQSRQGSYFWGTVDFFAVSEGRLEGQWAYCDRPPGSGGAWNGVQVGGAPILDAPEPAAPVQKGGGKQQKAAVPLAGPDVNLDQAYATLDDAFRSTVPYDELQEITFDLTCDGGQDVVFGWPEGSNPDRLGWYNVMVVHDEGRGEGAVYDLLQFPSDGSQFALCTGPGGWPEARLEIEYMGQLEPGALGVSEACGAKLLIDDGYCDYIRVYWNVGGGPDARFILDRN